MLRFTKHIIFSALLLVPILVLAAPSTTAKKYAGYFVIERGRDEVWYIPPHKSNPKRYCIVSGCEVSRGQDKNPCFLKDVSRRDLDRIALSRERARAVSRSFLGRILPDTVNEAEAWYVDPRTRKRYGVGAEHADAIATMRARARVVSAQEMRQIPLGLSCEAAARDAKNSLVLHATPLGCNAVRLEWNDFRAAEAYVILRDGVSIVTVTSNVRAYEDGALPENTIVSYAIRAVNASGTVATSAPAAFASGHCAPPPPPIEPPQPEKRPPLPPAISSVSLPVCNALQVRWRAAPGATGYKIFRNNIGIADVAGDATTFIDANLNENTTYSYSVSTVNADGLSDPSSERSFRTIACSKPPIQSPTRPALTSVKKLSCSLLMLEWQDVPDDEGYELFRDGRFVASFTPNTTRYADGSLQEQTTYSYALRSFRTVNGVKATSQISMPLTGATDACPTNQNIVVQPPQQPGGGSLSQPPVTNAGQPPPVPQFLGAVPVSCDAFLLRWTDVGNEDGYEIYREGILLQRVGVNTTEFTDSNLAPASNYQYSVRSYNTFGESPSSNALSFKAGTCTVVAPPPPPPPPPQVSTTTAACFAVGGTTCQQGEVCGSRWRDVTGDNRCCATACQAYRIADRCNHNSICEPQEKDTCSDCQCRDGVVCGGLCYAGLADEATCVDSTLVHNAAARSNASFYYCADVNCAGQYAACLLPGPCMPNSGIPVKVTVNLPRTLEVGVWTQGTIAFLNTGSMTFTNSLYFDVRGMELEVTRNGQTTSFPTSLDLTPFVPNTLVTYPIRARMQTLTDGWTPMHQMKRATIGIRFTPTGSTMDQAYIGVQSATAQSCGGYAWNLPGRCMGTILYPGSSCTAGNSCLGRVSTWTSYPATYQAKGTFKALLLTVDLDQTKQSQYNGSALVGFGNEMRAFYRREAERIVGRPMVDFDFVFGGHMQWQVPDFQFVFLQGQQTIRDYVEKKLGTSLKSYQFVVMAVPSIPLQASVGEAGGLYLGDGMIVLKADPTIMHAANMAHEFSHGFGCSDPWMGGADKYFLCNERRANNLLCGAEYFAPEIMWFKRATEGYSTLAYRRLDDCAGEMGWGDIDNNGTPDIEDPNFRP